MSDYRITSRKNDEYLFPRPRIKRIRVLWRKWRSTLDKSMTLDTHKLSTYQEKSIRLWRLCLKDDNTKLAYNTLGIRQIEKANLFITYSPAGDGYIMTIMDISIEKKNLYEVHIPSKHSSYALDLFDSEMSKRMRKIENTKRSIIESDIDKLIEQEEKALMNKHRSRKQI